MGEPPKGIELTRARRLLIGVVASGAVLIAGIGFAGSYAAVRSLALDKGFGWFANVFPIGVDAGIVVLLALDLLLTWLRIPFPLLRQTAWLLTAATIAFNGAAAWPDGLGVGMHAIIPVLFVVSVEAARHAIGRIADITADKHMEGVRFTRWLLAPFPTFRLWRRMKLWELRSYEEVIRREQDRLVYRARLRARYGVAWRRRAPVEAIMPLRLAKYGVPLADTAEAGLAAAGLDPLTGPAPKELTAAAPAPEQVAEAALQQAEAAPPQQAVAAAAPEREASSQPVEPGYGHAYDARFDRRYDPRFDQRFDPRYDPRLDPRYEEVGPQGPYPQQGPQTGVLQLQPGGEVEQPGSPWFHAQRLPERPQPVPAPGHGPEAAADTGRPAAAGEQTLTDSAAVPRSPAAGTLESGSGWNDVHSDPAPPEFHDAFQQPDPEPEPEGDPDPEPERSSPYAGVPSARQARPAPISVQARIPEEPDDQGPDDLTPDPESLPAGKDGLRVLFQRLTPEDQALPDNQLAPRLAGQVGLTPQTARKYLGAIRREL